MKPKMFSLLFLDDQTRVILKEQNVSGGDYINANYVNVGHPEIGQDYWGNTGDSFLFVSANVSGLLKSCWFIEMLCCG